MIRNALVEIGGIGILGLVSLILFFTVFVGMLMKVLFLQKPYVSRMKHLPLEESEGIGAEAGEPNDA